MSSSEFSQLNNQLQRHRAHAKKLKDQVEKLNGDLTTLEDIVRALRDRVKALEGPQ